jgi:hypothetical protein
MNRPARPRATALLSLLAAAVLLVPCGACRSVTKGGGVFHARASGFNILTLTLPEADFDVARRLVDEEVGDTARITNVRSSGNIPPWYNVFLQIIGWETYEISGTY